MEKEKAKCKDGCTVAILRYWVKHGNADADVQLRNYEFFDESRHLSLTTTWSNGCVVKTDAKQGTAKLILVQQFMAYQLWGKQEEENEELEAQCEEQQDSSLKEVDEDFGLDLLLEPEAPSHQTSKTVAKQLVGLFPSLLKCYSCKQLLDFPYQHPFLAPDVGWSVCDACCKTLTGIRNKNETGEGLRSLQFYACSACGSTEDMLPEMKGCAKQFLKHRICKGCMLEFIPRNQQDSWLSDKKPCFACHSSQLVEAWKPRPFKVIAVSDFSPENHRIDMLQILPTTTTYPDLTTGKVTARIAAIDQQQVEQEIWKTVTKFVLSSPARKNGEPALAPHQITALVVLLKQWSLGKGMIYGDVMGMGKTIVMVMFMAYISLFFPKFPFLVVAAPRYRDVWANEMIAFTNLKYYDSFPQGIAGRQFHHSQIFRNEETPHVFLCSQPGLRIDNEFFRRLVFSSVLVDEAQGLLEQGSKDHYCTMHIQSLTKVLISGTPLGKDPLEIGGLLHLLDPSKYTLDWKRTVLKKAFDRFAADPSEIWRLQKIFDGILYLRNKEDWMPNTVAPIEMWDIFVKATPTQSEAYVQRGSFLEKLKCTGGASGSDTVRKNITRATFSANKSAENGSLKERGNQEASPNAEDLLSKACKYKFNVPHPLAAASLETIAMNSGKATVLAQLLPLLQRANCKAVIFAMYSWFEVQPITHLLDRLGLRYEVLIGSMTTEEKHKAVQNFQTNAAIFALIGTDGAAGTGVTLTAGNISINFAIPFTPGTLAQNIHSTIQ